MCYRFLVLTRGAARFSLFCNLVGRAFKAVQMPLYIYKVVHMLVANGGNGSILLFKSFVFVHNLGGQSVP